MKTKQLPSPTIKSYQEEIKALRAVIENQENMLNLLIGEQESSAISYSVFNEVNNKTIKRKFNVPNDSVMQVETPEGETLTVLLNVDGRTLEIWGSMKIVVVPRTTKHVKIKNSYIATR